MTDYIILKLQEMPVWTNIPPEETIDLDKILRILHEIDEYHSDVIRKAITVFYKSDASVDDMGRLLILNKFLFDLPEWIPINSYRSFGGWLGIPEDGDRINLLWPFSQNEDGSLALTKRFLGYMGEAYLALEAFDYYLKRYGRRNILNDTNESQHSISPDDPTNMDW